MMRKLLFLILASIHFPIMAKAGEFWAPRRISFLLNGSSVEALLPFRITSESFVHGYWLYENECQAKSQRHPMIDSTIRLKVGGTFYTAYQGATSQRGWDNGKLKYVHYFTELQYDSVADCLDYASRPELIKGVRLTFSTPDRSAEFSLSWRTDSEVAVISRFDYPKNQFTPVAQGQILSWYK